LKIATYNINSINRRLEHLLAWIKAAAPDVVCLQELKAQDQSFPSAAIRAAGYGAAWVGQKTWNGVAILAREADPVITRRALPGDASDRQSRYLEAAVNGVLVACIYLPNGNPNPGPKFDYKLAWFERLLSHAADLHAQALPVVLAGDYNVAPTDLDIYQPNHWAGDALIDPKARSAFQRLLAQGWTDALRALYPGEPLWTFWAYLHRRWENDKGLRLDHLLLSPDLAARLTAGGVDRSVRDLPGASDHAPAWISLDV
jgi:exodeoxyribonuclease-3